MMIDTSAFAFYMIWGSCGLAMAIAYMIGKMAGYKQLHSQISDTIVDIQMESERISKMKKEISKIEKQFNSIKEEK